MRDRVEVRFASSRIQPTSSMQRCTRAYTPLPPVRFQQSSRILGSSFLEASYHLKVVIILILLTTRQHHCCAWPTFASTTTTCAYDYAYDYCLTHMNETVAATPAAIPSKAGPSQPVASVVSAASVGKRPLPRHHQGCQTCRAAVGGHLLSSTRSSHRYV